MDGLGYADLSFLMGLEDRPEPLTPWRGGDLSVDTPQDSAVLAGLGKWMIKLIRDPKTAEL